MRAHVRTERVGHCLARKYKKLFLKVQTRDRKYGNEEVLHTEKESTRKIKAVPSFPFTILQQCLSCSNEDDRKLILLSEPCISAFEHQLQNPNRGFW